MGENSNAAIMFGTIVAEAAASRVAVLVWAVVANLLIPDHNAEGVRLWHAETFATKSR